MGGWPALNPAVDPAIAAPPQFYKDLSRTTGPERLAHPPGKPAPQTRATTPRGKTMQRNRATNCNRPAGPSVLG